MVLVHMRLKAAVLHGGNGGERWEAIDVQVEQFGRLDGTVQAQAEFVTAVEKVTWIHGHGQESRVARGPESSVVMGALTLLMDDTP